jgi:SAM-dependent methyltransferase
MDPSILSDDLAALQHEWLRGARARLLRLAQIAHRKAVLELGAGQGLAAEELADRCGASVTAVDICEDQIRLLQQRCGSGVCGVRADACCLPFRDNSFDLVFAQFAFLWFSDTDAAIDEAMRVLRPDGALVVIEPDYEAMIEYPLDLGLQELSVDALQTAGACTHIGRLLAARMPRRGLKLDVLLPDRWVPFESQSLEFIGSLVESDSQRRELDAIRERIRSTEIVVHLPLMMLHGRKQK